MVENRLLRRLFGPKRDKGTGEWRKLHTEELNDLHSSLHCLGNEIENEVGGACSMYGGQQRCIQGFGGKPKGKRPIGRSRHRWENNIKKVLQEVECEGKDWIDVAHNRDRWRALVNAVMNLRVP